LSLFFFVLMPALSLKGGLRKQLDWIFKGVCASAKHSGPPFESRQFNQEKEAF